MYIRTEDGVYEVVGFDKECIIPSPLIKVKNNYGEEKITHCCKDDIINQSENLAELCDEFVLYDNQLNTRGVFDKKVITFKWLQNHLEIYKGMTIYGCIWTDDGLKYVAKMNDKGELELI